MSGEVPLDGSVTGGEAMEQFGGYFGTAAAELDHTAGNHLKMALLKLAAGIQEGERFKAKFLFHMGKALTLPAWGKITGEIINQIKAEAEAADWNNETALNELMARIRALRN